MSEKISIVEKTCVMAKCEKCGVKNSQKVNDNIIQNNFQK